MSLWRKSLAFGSRDHVYLIPYAQLSSRPGSAPAPTCSSGLTWCCLHRPLENSLSHRSLEHLPPTETLIAGSFLFSSSTSIAPTLGCSFKVSCCWENSECLLHFTVYHSLLTYFPHAATKFLKNLVLLLFTSVLE